MTAPSVCNECARGAHERCTDLCGCPCSQAPWARRILAEQLLDRYRRARADQVKVLRDCGVGAAVLREQVVRLRSIGVNDAMLRARGLIAAPEVTA